MSRDRHIRQAEKYHRLHGGSYYLPGKGFVSKMEAAGGYRLQRSAEIRHC